MDMKKLCDMLTSREDLKDIPIIYSGRRYYGNDAQYDSPYYRARGRRNARRDSMGRYSRGNDMMIEELRELMDDAPDERTRAEFERLITKMER